MQAFELYFNPKKKNDLFLTSSAYAPVNIYEKRLGNLYVVGELTQALPQNSKFLANLSSVIKKEYYASGLKKSCEASLQEALKKGNEFLDGESKKGNVGWLGNLNFGVISFKDPILNFAKTGNIKIFLVRNNELLDVSQNLDSELPHPDPLKVFGSMAGGKLSSDDKIIVLNKSVLSSLCKKQGFLGSLAKVADEKGLKQALKIHKDILANVSGICLVLMVTGQEDVRETLTFQRDLPSFSFSSAFLKPVKDFLAKIKLPHFKIPKVSLPKLQKPTLPKLPKINFVVPRKNIILVVGLILVLLIFYYIFGGERTQELKEAQQALSEAQTKAMLAESLLIINENDRAKKLFEEALEILSPLTKRGAPLREEALPLQNSIKDNLK